MQTLHCAIVAVAVAIIKTLAAALNCAWFIRSVVSLEQCIHSFISVLIVMVTDSFMYAIAL
jgi:hypothetical protein